MRGGNVLAKRAGAKLPPVNEATAKTFQAPAPYGGWNARGNIAAMPITDAIQMDNVVPGTVDVALRKGSATWSTGFVANIRSFLPYASGSASKLFASTAAGIYDVTAGGAIGAAVATCTNGNWITCNFTNSGGSWMTCVNGVDNLKLYDGTTWTTVTGVSAPAITGLATTSLSSVQMHKFRQWFIEKNSMNLWYLATNAVSGALTQFPVGPLFKHGGSLVAMGTWTIDAGSGPDDYFVFVTTKGELAMYKGTDPSSSTTWALVGVFDVAPPLGAKPFCDINGDLLYLCQQGLFPLSRLLQSAILDRTTAVSYKIDGAFLDSAFNYKNNFGWQVTLFKPGNLLLVNIPVSSDTVSYQYVMSITSKSWCRFLSWDASCWCVFNDELYYAGGTTLRKAWTGTADVSTPITGTVAQAYHNMGVNGQKQVSLVRPNISIANSATVRLRLDADFKAFGGSSSLTYSAFTGGSLWGTALWGTGIWDAGASPAESKWLTVPNDLGYLHSMVMEITTSVASFVWTSTNFAVKPAGIL